jgi:protein SPT2
LHYNDAGEFFRPILLRGFHTLSNLPTWQIGDLLAQITGDKSQASTTQTPRKSLIPKRKAEDDLRSDVTKASKPNVPPARPPQATKPFNNPKLAGPADKFGSSLAKSSPTIRHAEKPSLVQKSSNGTAKQPLVGGSRPSNRTNGLRVGNTSTGKLPPSTPSSAQSKAAPKKGSFAEIMARGQRAQAVMGQVGKIQHKPVEKGAIKKDREDMKAPPSKKSHKFQDRSRPVEGASKPRNGPHSSNGDSRDRRGGPIDRASGKKPKQETTTKVKKAATATTGYTGTARPLPGANKKKNAPRGGALLDTRSTARYGGSSRRSGYGEEFDEDLDDFIEYDDEEENLDNRRRGYYSDDSDDMEAGMDDIDEEEEHADYIARREDLDQELLERRLKAEKEERKKSYYNDVRNRR